MSTEYNLKKLRALCLDIHDEQTAILLRSCLAEFPIPVINEFFNGPKLNKPSNPDEREWTDLVRLFFIAMAPEGSDPAKLRGTPFGRYKRETPYDADRNDADALGVLTLYQTFKSSSLLKDIATGLGITALKIQSDHWLECYLNNPFPIKAIDIYINDQKWKLLPTPLRCLEEEFSAAVDLLPENLVHLSLSFGSLSFGNVGKFPKLIGSSIGRLTALASLRLEIDSLPEGIDFSKNHHLESIDLEIKKGGPKPIAGIAGLKNLKSLKIESGESIALESIAPLFNQGIDLISLAGVNHLKSEICGEMPQSFELGGVSGLQKITLTAKSPEGCILKIGKNFAFYSLNHPKNCDIEFIQVCGDIRQIEVENCPRLLSLQSHIRSSCNAFKISDCESLSKINAIFEAKIKNLELVNLPALSETSLKAPSGCSEEYSRAQCKFVNIGSKHLPSFKGAWKDFSGIEISDCPNLESLEGLHVLPDLRVAQLKNLSAMRDLFPPDASPLRSLTHLKAEKVRVQVPAGFESMPGLSKLDWHDCSLDSVAGVESLRALEIVDLTGSDLQSIAPFASLPLLKSIRVSKCEKIRPKPPRVLLEGDVLVSELSRATGGKITTGTRGEFLKVVELLSMGSIDDIKQAVHFIPLLTDEERGLLLTGASIAPETGWIRLPFLTKIKDDESQGVSQFQIIYALRELDPAAARILDSVDTIVLNPSAEQTHSALCFGAVVGGYSNKNDNVLTDFPSLSALPALKNITKIFVSKVSRFSLQGIANFPALESLIILGVDAIEHIDSLAGHDALKELQLATPDIVDFQEIGPLPALKTLYCRRDFKNLCGIESFPALRHLQTGSIDDLSELFVFSKKRGKTIAYKHVGFELV